jgi:predicted dehydrogenase
MDIGLIGCGRWGENILRDLTVLGCRVVVVARSEESRERARKHPTTETVDTIGKLSGKVAGVVVATPTSTRMEVLAEAVKLNVPIFVEKPLATSSIDVEELVQGRKMKPIFVMDKWRYHPGVEKLSDIYRSKSLGYVRGLRIEDYGTGNPHPDVEPIWTYLPHDLAIAMEILGHVPSCYSSMGTLGGWSAFIHLDGSPWSTISFSRYENVRRRSITLYCEMGTASLEDAYADHITVRFDDRPPEDWKISTEMPLLRELRAFVEYLEGGRHPKSGILDGFSIVRSIEYVRSRLS